MLNVRTLAALDIAFLGPRVILTEFALGVIGPIALGLLTLRIAASMGGVVFGVYLLTLGINYVPLLLHGIGIVRHETVRQALAGEPEERARVFRKYRRQSLLLLVPLLVPALALVQSRRSPPGG